jgi:hypothetical protein
MKKERLLENGHRGARKEPNSSGVIEKIEIGT